jgi:hypothetical protein
MTATTTPQDARSMTWQFVAPNDGAQLFAFAAPDDCPEDAITIAPAELRRHVGQAAWPAVAAPDLAAVVAEAGAGDAAATLELLGRQVAPGGWLLFGVANAWYPARRAGALSLARLRRAVGRAGLHVESVYLAMPDHHHPAVLTAARPAGALDQVLYRLPTTYVGNTGRGTGARRRARMLMVACAGAAPHALRVRFAPGYLVVARRPA